ncbi:DUF4873 domain-containing protein [Streptomyces boluensis]|uniref:DUF4873 domain-containing protein n=1 Tax=Streptomyces boluensis TaxID=1775135 RepID=A0A964UWT1_9ACTN|nr:DUF4873 domain-containing protein [Streptomyces boluensis]NBE55966.1 DUF4873 domain-containing protein [Streptomyces boluensis]
MAYEPNDRRQHEQHEQHGHEGGDDGYSGAATLVVDGAEQAVEVTLRGHFQPIDGRYHWYGRIAADAALVTRLGGKRTEALLRTPQGEALGELTDPDPWDRYRISGTSTPPFTLDQTLPEH